MTDMCEPIKHPGSPDMVPTDEQLIDLTFFECSIFESCDECPNRPACQYAASHGGLARLLAVRLEAANDQLTNLREEAKKQKEEMDDKL